MGEVLVLLGLAQATGNIWMAIMAPVFALGRASSSRSCPRSAIWRRASATPISTTRRARGAGSERASSERMARRAGGGARVPGGAEGPQRAATLPEWMAAIAAQGFADKNDTIDWLRAQGFPFARASWLERIHTNGGKPIYLDEPPPPRRASRRRLATKPAPPPPASPRPPSARQAAALEKLLLAAKGYRPLYHLLEAEIRRGHPRRRGQRRRRATSRLAARASSRPPRCTPPSCGWASISAIAPSMRRCNGPR